ncbi:MAG: redoxin domain-containing protein [Candidatus Rokubacteria bacterium]|nr:redoxin domain-containing protein [Candidatus Rokubacteria bacterium]
MTLRYGQPAPDFSLPSSLGREVGLAEFKGQADVVVAFFCYAWGGI